MSSPSARSISILDHFSALRDNVAEIVACARARWKIENESFNVLKSNGYHLEHNFGHGKRAPRLQIMAMRALPGDTPQFRALEQPDLTPS